MISWKKLMSNPDFLSAIRSKLGTWPGYQQIPLNPIRDLLKLKLRVFISLISNVFKMSFSDWQAVIQSNRKSGTFTGRILVLANGPSVNLLSVQQIQNFLNGGGKLAVMNGYVESPLSEIFIPDFYFMMDPVNWALPKSGDFVFKNRLEKYLKDNGNKITFVQPVGLPKYSLGHGEYLMVSSLCSSGLFRAKNPFICWGLASSTMLVSLAVLKRLGFNEIFVGGVDGNSYLNYEVDNLNQIHFKSSNHHFYEVAGSDADDAQSSHFGVDFNRSILRGIHDVLYAEAILRRDFHDISQGKFFNVTGGLQNDLMPQVSLVSGELVN
jgi:hypothetical protein